MKEDTLEIDQEDIVLLDKNTNPEAHNPEQLGRNWRSELNQPPDNHGRNWRVTL